MYWPSRTPGRNLNWQWRKNCLIGFKRHLYICCMYCLRRSWCVRDFDENRGSHQVRGEDHNYNILGSGSCDSAAAAAALPKLKAAASGVRGSGEIVIKTKVGWRLSSYRFISVRHEWESYFYRNTQVILFLFPSTCVKWWNQVHLLLMLKKLVLGPQPLNAEVNLTLLICPHYFWSSISCVYNKVSFIIGVSYWFL